MYYYQFFYYIKLFIIIFCRYKNRLTACIDNITQVYDKKGTHKIYHIALENDNYYTNYSIYANGLLVESCSKRYLNEYSDMTLIK